MNDDEINLLRRLRKKLTIAENNLIDSQCHISELEKKLAEYENMKPVAWVMGDEEIDDFNRGYEVCVMRDCDDPTLEYIPLYRHLNK